MTARYLTDTHPLVWHLMGDPRLSYYAKSLFVDADNGWSLIEVPGIVLIEMVYLAEKGVISKKNFSDICGMLSTPGASYRVASLDHLTAKTMLDEIPWTAIPELADRIISATARSLTIPLITKDRRIIDSGLVETVW